VSSGVERGVAEFQLPGGQLGEQERSGAATEPLQGGLGVGRVGEQLGHRLQDGGDAAGAVVEELGDTVGECTPAAY
jgi:hypothetical protein